MYNHLPLPGAAQGNWYKELGVEEGADKINREGGVGARMRERIKIVQSGSEEWE